jgi:hypothetical protein
MKETDFLYYIRNKEVPPYPPNSTVLRGKNCYGILPPPDFLSNLVQKGNKRFFIRDEIQARFGMWAIVDKVWTKALAHWIGNRKVLEIMSGAGWLAKALKEYGVNIVATDNFSWQARDTVVYPVEDLEAAEAVKKYIDADVLLVSWPSYKSRTIAGACNVWGCERPIIYIGELQGGCTASDSFFKFFEETEPNDIPLRSWYGMHDTILIGHWTHRIVSVELPPRKRGGFSDHRPLPVQDSTRERGTGIKK